MYLLTQQEHRYLNPDIMSELKLKQLQFETDTWKRLLGFLIEENIHMKNRISDILKNDFDKNLLEELDDFHSRFIKEDELIGLLRNDAAEMDKLLAREIFEDGIITREVNRKLRRLGDNMLIAEKQFTNLKAEFNSYLSENI